MLSSTSTDNSSSGFGPSFSQSVVEGVDGFLLPSSLPDNEPPQVFCSPPIFELDIPVPHFALRRRNAIVEASTILLLDD
ncbi:35903_t:CDS:2 [Racocetra persica]|uniref:35903_t:CDS:1 n=1 Tax=Racocetra persica TaxID=160502 RepID=A0ACA9KW36_9GLOM|nr:35903_t:CDS:2 [Racocetra persica]